MPIYTTETKYKLKGKLVELLMVKVRREMKKVKKIAETKIYGTLILKRKIRKFDFEKRFQQKDGDTQWNDFW